MNKYIFSALVGYLTGSLNPAALLSKLKKKDLREVGTKNLGATNVSLTFGAGLGAAVTVFDILKAVIPYKLLEFIFPDLKFIGMVAGVFAVVLTVRQLPFASISSSPEFSLSAPLESVSR